MLLAGLASLVAGAASMAVGESVSMAAQVELLQRLLTDYREHLKTAPEQAREELEEFIQRGGVRQATAHNASHQIALIPDRALAVCTPGRSAGARRGRCSCWSSPPARPGQRGSCST